MKSESNNEALLDEPDEMGKMDKPLENGAYCEEWKEAIDTAHQHLIQYGKVSLGVRSNRSGVYVGRYPTGDLGGVTRMSDAVTLLNQYVHAGRLQAGLHRTVGSRSKHSRLLPR